jgi:curved DNA-binding protein CbpA
VTDRPWGQTLGALAKRGLSGQLTVTSEGKPYRIAFADGAIVGASSPLASDAAVRIALTGGLISSTSVAEITRRVASSPHRDEIEVIAEAARLGSDQAQKLRRRLVAQRAARTFSLEKGDFVIEDQITVPVVPGSELDVRAVINLGARGNLSETRLSDELLMLGVWFKLVPDAVPDLGQFGFTELDKPVLQALINGANLADIENDHPDLGDRGVRAIVYALAAYGACEVSATEVPSGRVRKPSTPPRSGDSNPPSLRGTASGTHRIVEGLQLRTPRASTQPPVRTQTPPSGMHRIETPSGTHRIETPSGTHRIETPSGMHRTQTPATGVPRATSPTQPSGPVPRATSPTQTGRAQSPTTSGQTPPIASRTQTPTSMGRTATPTNHPALTPPSPSRTQTPTRSGRTPTPNDPAMSRAPTAPMPGRTVTGRTPTPQEPTDPQEFPARTPTPTEPFTARTMTPLANRAPSPGGPVISRTTSQSRAQLLPRPAATPPRSARPSVSPMPTRSRTNTAATLETESLIRDRLLLLERNADHYQLLGLSQDATPDLIRAAYFTLARKLHPDRLASLGIHDPNHDAQRVMAQINTAFAVLNDNLKRIEYLGVLSRGGESAVRAEDAKADEMAMKIMHAEEAFRRGEMALRREQLDAAIAEFSTAVELQPQEAEYQALLIWAKFAAAADKQVIARQTRIELARAADRSLQSPTARFYLGRVERILGREREALEHFYEVLRIKSNHAEASSEIRVLETRLKKR